MKAKYNAESLTVVELPEMKEPEKILAHEWGWSDYEKDIYYGQWHEYNEQKAKCKTYPVIGNPPLWKDGDILEEGVDFYLKNTKKHIPYDKGEWSRSYETVTVAIPDEQDTCSNHRKEVAGISDMKVLAELIGDLHYESLAELFWILAEKIGSDAMKDKKNGKEKLSLALRFAASHLIAVSDDIKRAWQISKPFMSK